MDSKEESTNESLSPDPDMEERMTVIDAPDYLVPGTTPQGYLTPLSTPAQSTGVTPLKTPSFTPLKDRSINVAAVTKQQLQKMGVELHDPTDQSR